MSLESLTTKVLVEYKADISDMRRGLRELQGEERKLAEAQIAAAEKKNHALEGTIKKIGQVGLAFDVVIRSAKFAFEAIEKYGKHLDLVGTAGSVSINSLSKAAMGLKTNMELLSHAAVFNKSAFKLTQSQMETVEKAMYVLEERGKSSEEVWNAVSSALTKGTTRSLEGLGIIIDKTGLSLDENGLKMDTYGQKAKGVERIMAALAGTAKEAEGAQLDAADKVQAATTRMKNYFDEAIVKIGQLAAQLAPIIDMLASAAGIAGDLINKIPGGGSTVAAGLKYATPGIGQALAMRDMASSLYNGGNMFDVIQGGKAGMKANDILAQMSALQSQGMMWNAKIDANAGNSYSAGTDRLNEIAGKVLGAMGDAVTRAASDPWGNLKTGKGGGRGRIVGYDLGGSVNSPWGTSSALEGPSDVYGDEFGRPLMDSIDLSKYGRTQSAADEYNSYNAGKSQSKLEEMFGPIEHVDAYRTAIDTLAGATTTMFSAWIEGSMSAGTALKKFFGESLKGVATQLAAEAIKESVFALGSLAMLDFPGAARHAKAAAAAGAGAIAVGAMAKAMHSSGSSGASAGGGPTAPSSVPASNSGGGGAQIAVIAFGQDYSNDSSRQRQLRAAKVLEDAKASGAFPGVRVA